MGDIIQDDNKDEIDSELSFLKEKAKILLNVNNNDYLIYDNINNNIESNFKNPKSDYKLNEFKINQRLNNKNNLNTLDNNTIYYSYIEECELCNNNLINDNFNKYYNIKNSKNGYLTNENIENYNQNSLELKDNIKKPKIRKKHKKVKLSNNMENNKFKVISKLSNYRGVTKNRKKWQVFISIKGKNIYLGTYNSEKFAAKIYDFMAINKKGNKAKTNFKYNINQINEISKMDINIDNISDIVYKMYI